MPLIKKRTWAVFLISSLLSIIVWKTFTAPQLSFINLSVGRAQALKIASDYLAQEVGLSLKELSGYKHAVVFSTQTSADRYLQKAIGFTNELAFLKKFDFELFMWSVRFFKENQKEEYRVSLSASTGEILTYLRIIDANAQRPFQNEESARAQATAFLKKRFNFDPQLYLPQETNSQKLEKRTDYSFSWEHKGSEIRWTQSDENGWAMISTGVTIAGDEILGFYKNHLKLPDQYTRHLESNQSIGWNLSTIFRIFFYIILTACIYYVLANRNSIIMHSVKNFAVALTFFVFILYLLSYFNNFEEILFDYPTTQPLASYLARNIVLTIMNISISALSILMPVLAATCLHAQLFENNKEGSFLYYIRSTFFSRNVASAITLGYLTATIMLGIQALAFEIGQRYFGVWIEYSWMTQTSASYFPALGAFILAATASLSEEISFRFLGISMGKKFFKNTLLACAISSMIWGYGHSGYPIFPMWFRSLEIMSLGLFLSYVYLRFGILAVLSAHYLFNAFWESCVYLLGKSEPAQFYGSLGILLLPMFFAFVAFFINKKVPEKPLRWKLSVHQLFNLQVLKEYVKTHDLLAEKPPEKLKHEIVSHGWDLAVVETMIEDLSKKKD